MKQLTKTVLQLAIVIIVVFVYAPLSYARGIVTGYAQRGGQNALQDLNVTSVKVQRSCPGATIKAYLVGTSTLATIYATAATSTAIPNSQVTSDTSGLYTFYTDAHEIDVEITCSGIGTFFNRNVRPISMVNSVCNAKDYGVKGDGTTNDSTALDRASDTCGPNSTIFIPAGTYMYGGSVSMYDGQAFVGAGYGSTVFKWIGAGSEKLLLYNDASNALTDVTIRDIGFDFNGHPSEFTTFISISNSRRVTVRGCRFFDSNPPTRTETIAIGDGVTTSFNYTLLTSTDEQPISETLTINAGASLTATDNGVGGWTGNVASAGSVDYTREAVLTVNFSSAPANGQTITITYSYCSQRFGILLLNSLSSIVDGNFLSHGQRIKIGQPGESTMVINNHIRDTNDNAIALIVNDNHTTQRIQVSGNIVVNPSTAGIYIGTDGAETGAFAAEIIVSDNVITNPGATGIGYTIPATTGPSTITGNTVFLKYVTGLPNCTGIRMIQSGDAPPLGGKVIVASNNLRGPFDLAAIDIQTQNDVLVYGNMITGSATRAVRLSASNDVTIASNHFNGTLIGVSFFAGTSNRINLLNNVIVYSGTSTNSGVSFASGGSVVCVDCRIQGGSISGPAHGIRNNSGGSVELDIINVDLDDNTTAAITLASGSWAATSEWKGVNTTFAGLPTIKNGSILFCTDCTKAAPTASGGTGAVVKRENGAWNGD